MVVWCQVGNVFITIHTAVPVGSSSLCSGNFLRRANGFALQQWQAVWRSGPSGHWSQTWQRIGWGRGSVIERGRSTYPVSELSGGCWLPVGANFSFLSLTGRSPGEWEGRDRVPPVFAALEGRKAWCVGRSRVPKEPFPHWAWSRPVGG